MTASAIHLVLVFVVVVLEQLLSTAEAVEVLFEKECTITAVEVGSKNYIVSLLQWHILKRED